MRWILFLICILFFSTNLLAEGCKKDSDCRFDRICVKGECVFHPIDEKAKQQQTPKEEPDWELLKMKSDIQSYKTSRAWSIVGVAVCFPLSLGSFISGGVFYREHKDEENKTEKEIKTFKNLSIMFFTVGGIQALLGIISVVRLGHYNGLIGVLENEVMLREAGALVKGDRFSLYMPEPVFSKSDKGDFYGISLGGSFF